MKYADVFPLPTEWLTDVDESLAEAVARWAEQEVMARRLEHGEDRDALLAPAARKLFVDLGLQSLFWPESAGGAGLSGRDTALTVCCVLEEVGRADVGIGFLLANTLVVQAAFGVEPNRNEALLETLTPVFCSGETVLGALILPGYGNGGESPGVHGLAYQVKVSPDGGGWLLTGEDVRPLCAGADAGLFGVTCETEPNAPSLLLVAGTAEGLVRGAPFKKTGLAASLNADLEFRSVAVSGDRLVFSGGERYRETLGWYYLGCAALCQGALLAAWEILREWGETRVIKGKGQVFRENPLVAALMGKIGRRITTGRILAYNLARMLARPDAYGPPGAPAMLAAATAVARTVGQGAAEAINSSMELMASAGYATEWNLERYWRDVQTLLGHLGPATAAQMDMARHHFGCRSL